MCFPNNPTRFWHWALQINQFCCDVVERYLYDDVASQGIRWWHFFFILRNGLRIEFILKWVKKASIFNYEVIMNVKTIIKYASVGPDNIWHNRTSNKCGKRPNNNSATILFNTETAESWKTMRMNCGLNKRYLGEVQLSKTAFLLCHMSHFYEYNLQLKW